MTESQKELNEELKRDKAEEALRETLHELSTKDLECLISEGSVEVQTKAYRQLLIDFIIENNLYEE